MVWRLIETFGPRFMTDSGPYLIAGVYPNGLRWVECCYWDARGYFSGHKMEAFHPRWWRPMPEAPTDEEDKAMRELDGYRQAGLSRIEGENEKNP